MRQPGRDGIAATILDLKETVHLHHPTGTITSTRFLVALAQVRELHECCGYVHLSAFAHIHLEIVEPIVGFGIFEGYPGNSVASEGRLHPTAYSFGGLFGTGRGGVRELHRHSFANALGQIRTFTMGLPTTKRGERAIGNVALGLPVTNEANLNRICQPLTERIGVLQLSRSDGFIGVGQSSPRRTVAGL